MSLARAPTEPHHGSGEEVLLAPLGKGVAENSPFLRLKIAVSAWLSEDADLLRFDEQVHALEDRAVPFRLVLEGDPQQAKNAAQQVLTRYQRLLPPGNDCCLQVLELLPSHRALFDCSKPLVRADYDHALDTWRWVLRMDHDASVALQIAALFHDIERLSSEADVRVEQRAPDYLEFKRKHAAVGALKLTQLLMQLGFALGVVQRVAELVRSHEEPDGDAELALLNDADSLSFFSLNSWGFLNYFGAEHTRVKVRYTLGRMSTGARAVLPTLRQHRCVAEYIRQYVEECHE